MSSSTQNNAVCKEDGTFHYDEIFSKLGSIESDYLCGNLETPIGGELLGYTSTGVSFNTPEALLQALKNVGFNMLYTANNHVMDRGIAGVNNTIAALDRYGFDHTGTYTSKRDSEEILMKKFGETKVSFLSFTYGTNAEDHHNVLQKNQDYVVDIFRAQPIIVDSENHKKTIFRRFKNIYKFFRLQCERLYYHFVPYELKLYNGGVIDDCVSENHIGAAADAPYIERLISKIHKAKEQSDIVILCLHIGGQYNSSIAPYTEYIYSLLKELPVDVIVGNHPHCVLPGYKEDGKIITYSLGNFTFTPNDGWYNPNAFPDYSILLHIDIDDNKKQISGCRYSIMIVQRNEDDLSFTRFLFDVINEEKDENKKSQYIQDNAAILKRFTGLEISEIKKEYML